MRSPAYHGGVQRAFGLFALVSLLFVPACFEDEPDPEDQSESTGDECPGAAGCACMSNTDCDGGVQCEGGFCNEDECMSFQDCPAEEPICVQGACEVCNEAADACQAGTMCMDGMCVSP